MGVLNTIRMGRFSDRCDRRKKKHARTVPERAIILISYPRPHKSHRLEHPNSQPSQQAIGSDLTGGICSVLVDDGVTGDAPLNSKTVFLRKSCS